MRTKTTFFHNPASMRTPAAPDVQAVQGAHLGVGEQEGVGVLDLVGPEGFP
jgi:hypothetical protein